MNDLPALLTRLDTQGVRVPESGLDESVRLGELIAARLPLPNTCLFRALARYSIGRRARVDVELRLGVRGDLEGHAWVLRDGVPWLEPAAPPHEVTFAHRFDPRSARR